ncbi:hypothetical protein HK103_006334 [Boothiomyces macroporosus]|uniref:Uncharacterized protein n=1 Tax=Boothiomyces macroporosus TaxID=261099 RepID=A0AAD5Y2M0_9FUNG|nr:hypothetical protein HK103_006334 [Boothiomyces macroporosus]
MTLRTVPAFDPTIVDPKERDRLSKSKWYMYIKQAPAISESCRIAHPPGTKQTNPNPCNSKEETKDSKASKQARYLEINKGSDRFPKLDIVKSDQMKLILKINQSARFLMTLHEKSLEHKRRQEQLQEKRKLNANQSYDWVIVKQISQEYQFLKYIENLKQRGQFMTEQLREEDRLLIGHLVESMSNKEDSQPREEMINANQPKVARVPVTTEKGLALIKDFLDTVRSNMRSSPFRPKLKGQTSMMRHYPDREKDHVFGKPPKFTEEMAMEFNRTFGEIETLSANVQIKLTAVESDSELFEIAPTIAAAIEAMQGTTKLLSKSDKKLDTPKSKETIAQSVAELLKKEFITDQHIMQKQLLKYLRLRSTEKLQKSLEIDTMVETQNLATSRVNKCIQNAKLTPITLKEVPNLWMHGKVAETIPFEFSKIGIVENMNPVSITHGYHRDRPAPAIQDPKLNLTKTDTQSRLDEQINAIKLMFAQEFGDLPQKDAK